MSAHIDYNGNPIVETSRGTLMIDCHVQKKHPILCFILQIVAKRLGKTARHSHLQYF